VYADEFTESYLATETNVITINKSEAQSKTVSVSVQNPTGQSTQTPSPRK
jgi:hypothetical protein